VRQILRGEGVATCLNESRFGVFIYDRAIVETALERAQSRT
jgi:hypothetical protein